MHTHGVHRAHIRCLTRTADINECKTDGAWPKCSKYATCTNTVGGYTCACKTNYGGDGFVCIGERRCRSMVGSVIWRCSRGA